MFGLKTVGVGAPIKLAFLTLPIAVDRIPVEVRNTPAVMGFKVGGKYFCTIVRKSGYLR